MTRRNMRRPKASLKKYFYFTLICALLLIFGFNIKESEVWKTKAPATLLSTSAQQQKHQPEQQSESSKQQHNHQQHPNRPHQQEQFILGNNQNEYEYDDDYDDDDATYGAGNGGVGVGVDVGAAEDHGKVQSKRMETYGSITIRTSHTKTETETTDSELSEQQQQQNRIASSPLVLANRSWFFKNGKTYPKPATSTTATCKKCKRRKAHLQGAKLFPYQDPHHDRIVNQLMYVPPNYDEIKASGKLKTILLYNGLGPWNIKPGREIFLRSKCPVDTCEITAVRERANTVDMILYKDYYMPSGSRRSNNSKQVTMLYYLECPYHTQNVKVPSAINWTATYRRDSDIVAPYEKWVYYDDRIHQMEQDHNYAANKTKKVAWFVSNCGARNGRLQYAHELAKHIDVDIYGACGNYKCSRTTADKCFELLDRDYKFYLAFENSNCRDYVTEKFFVNALNRNILPIVMGARPEDYEVSAPQRSYIHVDEFASAKELADYLHILDKDDKLYNSYFTWKGTGEFINTYYWCRLCAALHDEESLRKPRWYPDVNDWWRGPGVCTISSWRNFKARKDIISDD